MSDSTNPKLINGIKKVPMSVVPAQVMLEVSLALFEGARKYGRSNYRGTGVKYSTYYDACFRHLMAFFEGEDIDQDSGLSHVTKAIASLVVLRDSMMQSNAIDDRPPKVATSNLMTNMNKKAEEIIKKIPECVEPVTEFNCRPTNKIEVEPVKFRTEKEHKSIIRNLKKGQWSKKDLENYQKNMCALGGTEY